MKKVLLFVIVSISVSSILNAQISKGSVLLGGSFTGSVTKAKYESSSSDTKYTYSIRPTVGIAIKQNTIVGIEGSFGNTNLNFPKSYAWGTGLFLRKYFPLGKNFYLFGQTGIGYFSSTDKIKELNPTLPLLQTVSLETRRINLYIYPGVSYAVSKRFHLEASLNNLASLYFAKSELKTFSAGTINTETHKTAQFESNISSATPFSIGLRFLLLKK